MDTDKLRLTYQKFSDEHLLRLATVERESLEPEALGLLDEVIKERQLDVNREALDSFINAPSEEKLEEYLSLVSTLPCPVCERRDQKLNATVVYSAISLIFITSYEKELRIACPNCLLDFNKKANIKTALFGWWAIPYGPIRSIQSIYNNIRFQKISQQPNDWFKSRVIEMLPSLELHKNSPVELARLLKHKL